MFSETEMAIDACASASDDLFAAFRSPTTAGDVCSGDIRNHLEQTRVCVLRALSQQKKADPRDDAAVAHSYLRLGLLELRFAARGVRHVLSSPHTVVDQLWTHASVPAAIVPLRAALALRPGCIPAHRALGLALLPEGPSDLSQEPYLPLAIAAAEAFRHAAALAPGSEDVWLKLAAVLVRSREAATDPALIVSVLQHAVSANPTSPRALQQLVSVLQWQRRTAEADAVVKDAVATGVWQLPLQRPARFERGLRATPFWRHEEVAPGLCERLRSAHDAIDDELEELLHVSSHPRLPLRTRNAARACAPQDEGLHTPNSTWLTCELMQRCMKASGPGGGGTDLAFLPRRTCAALLLDGGADGPSVLNARFSILHGGALVRPHTGTSNRRLVLHYGVRVPNGAWLRAGRRWAPFQPRECLTFDDSFEHEVWHLGSQPRATLVVQLLHPELQGH